jgi:Protein of unknown function (DUF3618)
MGTQSEQIEQQAHRLRAQISETIQAIRDRMTPGQVVDQVADYAQRGPAADFFRNLGREARENPLPLTLIAVGVLWLVIESSLSSRARSRVTGLDLPPSDAYPNQYPTNEEATRFESADRIVPVTAVPADEAKPGAAGLGTERAMDPNP